MGQIIMDKRDLVRKETYKMRREFYPKNIEMLNNQKYITYTKTFSLIKQTFVLNFLKMYTSLNIIIRLGL